MFSQVLLLCSGIVNETPLVKSASAVRGDRGQNQLSNRHAKLHKRYKTPIELQKKPPGGGLINIRSSYLRIL
jgi:hypothetical protein